MSSSQIEVADIEIPLADDSHSPRTAAVLQRDVSVAMATDSAGTIDNRVRAALAERANDLEQIIVLSQTRYMDLSTSSRRRLGIAPGQVHLQLRLVIRDGERTLTSDDANELRDAVVDVLHEGAVRNWASREMQL
jgi:phenylalanyl-tRNA synthetase alpha chain